MKALEFVAFVVRVGESVLRAVKVIFAFRLNVIQLSITAKARKGIL